MRNVPLQYFSQNNLVLVLPYLRYQFGSSTRALRPITTARAQASCLCTAARFVPRAPAPAYTMTVSLVTASIPYGPIPRLFSSASFDYSFSQFI